MAEPETVVIVVVEKKKRQNWKIMTPDEKREAQRIRMKNYRDKHREAYREQRNVYMKGYIKRVYEQAKKFKELENLEKLKTEKIEPKN